MFLIQGKVYRAYLHFWLCSGRRLSKALLYSFQFNHTGRDLPGFRVSLNLEFNLLSLWQAGDTGFSENTQMKPNVLLAINPAD